MPLTMAPLGEEVEIVKITGRDEQRRRLAELGFVVGEAVEVLTSISGSVILSVKGGRVALDRSMANKIMVK